MKKNFLCLSIVFIMIVSIFGAGCITTPNIDSGIIQPSSSTKFSISDIEKMASESNPDYIINVGRHEKYYKTFVMDENHFNCPLIASDSGRFLGFTVMNTDFSNYEIKDNVIILSKEHSFFIVLDEKKNPRMIEVSKKFNSNDEYDIDNVVGAVIYVDAESFNYLKDSIAILY